MIDTDRRKYNKDPRKGYDKYNNDRKSVHFGRTLINRIEQLARKRGFTSTSEFIRFACRKELDYQEDIISNQVPNIQQGE